jgi:hypothetical protein
MADPTSTANPDAERAKAIHNERTKLLATFFNGLAIAVIVVGMFSPTFAPPQAAPPEIRGISLQLIQNGVCLVVSFILHVLGRLTLGTIR